MSLDSNDLWRSVVKALVTQGVFDEVLWNRFTSSVEKSLADSTNLMVPIDVVELLSQIEMEAFSLASEVASDVGQAASFWQLQSMASEFAMQMVPVTPAEAEADIDEESANALLLAAHHSEGLREDLLAAFLSSVETASVEWRRQGLVPAASVSMLISLPVMLLASADNHRADEAAKISQRSRDSLRLIANALDQQQGRLDLENTGGCA